MSPPLSGRLSGLLTKGWTGRLPLACGAVGSFDPARVEAIAAAMPGNPAPVHRSEVSCLHLDRDAWAWQGRDGGDGLAWSEGPEPKAGSPRSRREAARMWAAAGIEHGPGGSAIVHASGLGLHTLYVQREGAATYFATRIGPLADASPSLLTIDWQAWAAIFEIGCPLGSATGFAEIERLEPGAWVEHRAPGADGVPGSDGWSWQEFGVERRDDPVGDILEAVRGRVGAVPLPKGRAVCPLSGGWDSRLIAFLLRERERKVKAVTINTDAGHRTEESLAGPVAEGLGASHELVATRNADYWQDWQEAARLQEHQCPIHLPMQALAAGLSPGPDPIFDGVSGDVLIKGWWVDGRILGAESWDSSARMLWRRFRFDTGEQRIFSEFHAEALRRSAKRQFLAQAARFDGHESAATLLISWARSRRSTAPSPMDLFGARGPVSLPFACDSVAEAALSVEPKRKLGGELYREMLDRADPRLAAWPSTNDAGFDAGDRDRKRRTLSAIAVRGYLERLRAHPLRPAFSGVFDKQVEQGKIRWLLRHRQGLVALDAICRFGDWHARHGASLKPFDTADLKAL
jgi:hypothetical protein